MPSARQLEGTVNLPRPSPHPPSLTLAQRSNLLDITARGYMTWRRPSLTLLTGSPLPLKREAEYFVSLCQPQPNQHWLDVGTSAGFYAGVLARSGAAVLACDLSPAMLREAVRAEPHPAITYALINAEQSGLPQASFDGITIGATLNETRRPQRMLAESQRLLRPGAQLWLMTLVRSGSAGQALLTRFGGLSFPELAQLDAWLPQMRRSDTWRRGNVLFGRWVKNL